MSIFSFVVHSNKHKSINLDSDGLVMGSNTTSDDYVAAVIPDPTIETLRKFLVIAGDEVGTDATVSAHISTSDAGIGMGNRWQITAHRRKESEDE